MDILITKQTNKENNNSTLNKQLQRLKIQLNDKIFQINKLEEDYAQQKAKQFINFQKERQTLNRTVKELKEKLQSQNEEWEKKIEEFREKSIAEKNQMRIECQKQIQKIQICIKQQYFRRYEEQIKSLKDEIFQKQIEHNQKLMMMQSQRQTTAQTIKRLQSEMIIAKDRQYQQNIQLLKHENEKTIKQLQNIYISEKDAKQAINKELQAYIQENVRQKISYEYKIAQLTEKNDLLTNQISKVKSQLNQSNESILELKKMHQQSIKSLNFCRIKETHKMIEDFNKKCEMQKRVYQSQINQMKQQIRQMCRIHSQKQKKWQQRGDILLKSIDTCQKKEESRKKIQSLETELMKKDSLLQKERQSLKTCKLQLENMEDIYDKMFVTNNYLYKYRSKSFKIKKMRVPNQLNESNSSIFNQQRIYTEGDK